MAREKDIVGDNGTFRSQGPNSTDTVTYVTSPLVTQKWNEKQSAHSQDATARSQRGGERCERNSLREHRARRAKQLEGETAVHWRTNDNTYANA